MVSAKLLTNCVFDNLHNRRDRCVDTLPLPTTRYATLASISQSDAVRLLNTFEDFVDDDVRTLRTWLVQLFRDLGLHDKPMLNLHHLGTASNPRGLIARKTFS